MTLYDQALELNRDAYAADTEPATQQEMLCRMADLLKTMASRIEELGRAVQTAGNAASCLANGIQPD